MICDDSSKHLLRHGYAVIYYCMKKEDYHSDVSPYIVNIFPFHRHYQKKKNLQIDKVKLIKIIINALGNEASTCD